MTSTMTSTTKFSHLLTKSAAPTLGLLLGSTLFLYAAFLYANFLYADADLHVKRVLVDEVRSADAAREARFPGITRAAKRARLAFLIGGRLVQRPAKIGDRVRKGEELARLDERELRHGVEAVRAGLEELVARRAQAERDAARAAKLVDAKAATPEELEHVRAGLDALRAAEQSAQARLSDAERRLGEARLLAPFDGVITNVLQEPGEMIAPGMPVVLLSGAGGLEVEIQVPASIVFALREGDSAEVELPMSDVQTTATLLSVGRTAGGPGSLFPVVLRLDEPTSGDPEGDRLLPGMSAEAVLHLAEVTGLSVPIEAVVNPGGQRPAVFRLSEEEGSIRVRKIRVEVGELLGDRVLIRGENLHAGDRVVIGGQRGLLDGDPVIVGAAVGDTGRDTGGEVNR